MEVSCAFFLMCSLFRVCECGVVRRVQCGRVVVRQPLQGRGVVLVRVLCCLQNGCIHAGRTMLFECLVRSRVKCALADSTFGMVGISEMCPLESDGLESDAGTLGPNDFVDLAQLKKFVSTRIILRHVVNMFSGVRVGSPVAGKIVHWVVALLFSSSGGIEVWSVPVRGFKDPGGFEAHVVHESAFRIWWFTEEAVVITNKTFQELADVLIEQSVAVVDGSRHKAGGVKQLFFEHMNAKLVLEVKATFGGSWNSHRVGRSNGRQQEEWVSADFRQWSGGVLNVICTFCFFCVSDIFQRVLIRIKPGDFIRRVVVDSSVFQGRVVGDCPGSAEPVAVERWIRRSSDPVLGEMLGESRIQFITLVEQMHPMLIDQEALGNWSLVRSTEGVQGHVCVSWREQEVNRLGAIVWVVGGSITTAVFLLEVVTSARDRSFRTTELGHGLSRRIVLDVRVRTPKAMRLGKRRSFWCREVVKDSRLDGKARFRRNFILQVRLEQGRRNWTRNLGKRGLGCTCSGHRRGGLLDGILAFERRLASTAAPPGGSNRNVSV